MSAIDDLADALEESSTALELRHQILWIFLDLLARHDGRPHDFNRGASAVAHDLEHLLKGWSTTGHKVAVADEQAVQNFYLTSTNYPGRNSRSVSWPT